MAHPGFVYDAQFSPDGTQVATAGADGAARLWDVATGKLLVPLLEMGYCVYTVTFSADGKQLGIGCSTRDRLSSPPAGVDSIDPRRILLTPRPGKPFAAVWDLASKTAVPLPVDNPCVTSLAFSGDGSRVALVGPYQSGTLVCDAHSGKVVAGPLTGLTEQNNIVVSVSLSPDGTRLITGMHNDTFNLWDVTRATQLGKSLPGGRALFVRGGELVTGHGLWTAATGEPVADQKSQEDQSRTYLRKVRWAGGGRYDLSPGKDHAARLRDLAGRAPNLLAGGSHSINARYSPDGRHLFVAGGEGPRRVVPLRVFDTEDGMAKGPACPPRPRCAMPLSVATADGWSPLAPIAPPPSGTSSTGNRYRLTWSMSATFTWLRSIQRVNAW